MIKKIYIDSDIILDLLAKREFFYKDAIKIFTLAYEKKIQLYTSGLVFANVFYILQKIIGTAESKRELKDLRLLIKIVPINEIMVDMALNSKIGDFEDALQYFAARENTIPAILTRNTNDFKIKDILIQTPGEYIKNFISKDL